ncbi:MAG: TlpA disulfide reductase family protein [Caulobacteraceae bacterium]|nr:TlpA disulfide reductase family protein [Caulobacteraceae bacterium]
MISTLIRLARTGLIGAALATTMAATPGLAAQVGKPAPAFTVTTFDHQTLSLDDLRGKVIVLNYWATWCAPCRAEMAAFDSYLRSHHTDDLKVFAITVDSTATPYQLRALARALAFPLILRLEGWGYGQIGGAVPTSYVIDRAGVLRYARAGAFTEASFDALITPMLAEAPPAPTGAPSSRDLTPTALPPRAPDRSAPGD